MGVGVGEWCHARQQTLFYVLVAHKVAGQGDHTKLVVFCPQNRPALTQIVVLIFDACAISLVGITWCSCLNSLGIPVAPCV